MGKAKADHRDTESTENGGRCWQMAMVVTVSGFPALRVGECSLTVSMPIEVRGSGGEVVCRDLLVIEIPCVSAELAITPDDSGTVVGETMNDEVKAKADTEGTEDGGRRRKKAGKAKADHRDTESTENGGDGKGNGGGG
jgi:hypothetical protein